VREHTHHHEEFERPERRKHHGHGAELHHHRHEMEGRERGKWSHQGEEYIEQRSHGERSHHHGPGHDGLHEGLHRHASWRGADEDGVRSGVRRERIERGMLRYLLLDALHHGPKHGYEIIKWLEEQTHGRYAPSAGTVYPTLQLLSDQGLILSEQSTDKSVYRLTEAGEAELQTQANFVQAFWERYGHPVSQPSVRLAIEFLHEELQELHHTVETGVRVLAAQADQTTLRSVRQVLERSKNEIRDLLAGHPTDGRPGNHAQSTPTQARELEEAIASVFANEDEVLQQTLVRASSQGLPAIQISAMQGKLLQVLARACQARKILEIGALAGYSGIWLARALPEDGQLITLEIDPTHAEVVRESFRQAGVADRAEVRVGPALETLPGLTDEGPFDLVFIDADKNTYPAYLAWALRLTRPGSIIVADNSIRGGSGLRLEETADQRNAGIRAYNERASSDPALCSIALPVNTGMTVSVVLAKEPAQS
jgi:caffeoyl-CoA O-methyltransferase